MQDRGGVARRVTGTGQAPAGRADYFILLHRRGALEAPICSQLVKSTGDKLGLPLASEVGSGEWEEVGSLG